MPLHQRRERGLIPLREEPFQELIIGEARHGPLDEQVVDLP